MQKKNVTQTILFVDLSKTFDSIYRGNMEKICLAYGLLEVTVVAITILYKITKVKVRSTDEDTDYFDIAAGVQRGET